MDLNEAMPEEPVSKPLPVLPRNRSLKTLLEHQFETLPIAGDWLNLFGSEPEVGFVMFVWGPSGSGKTTFCLRLSRYLSTLGKVYYNSIEQGFSKSFQDQVVRAGITADDEARFFIGHKDDVDIMWQKVSRTRPRFVVVDSVQFIKMTVDEFKQLHQSHPRTCFVLISWEAGGRPKGDTAKSLEYISDIKVAVKNGIATSKSRFGATKPYKVFGLLASNGAGQYNPPLEEQLVNQANQ